MDIYGLIIIIVLGALVAVFCTSTVVTCYNNCTLRKAVEAKMNDSAPAPIDIALSDMGTATGVRVTQLDELAQPVASDDESPQHDAVCADVESPVPEAFASEVTAEAVHIEGVAESDAAGDLEKKQ